MADNFIQVAADGVGKKMQTYLNTISASDVHAEAVALVNTGGSPLGTTGDSLNVYVGSLNATILGNINANQNGTWNISTLTSITNPVTVAQSNASNLAATVSGTVTVNAGTNLNTALLATSAKQSDGTQKTQISDPINVSNIAGVTSGGLNVYLPSITANAGTSLNTALLATSANLTAGTQKTQICDPTNVSNVAGITSGGLNVYLPSITANSGTNLNTGNVAVKVFQGGAFLASGQITIGNISTTIAGARATRRSATIRNQDATNSGYIGPAPIGTGNGLLLYPGDSLSVDFTGIIAGISLNTTNAGNVVFGYLETYD